MELFGNFWKFLEKFGKHWKVLETRLDAMISFGCFVSGSRSTAVMLADNRDFFGNSQFVTRFFNPINFYAMETILKVVFFGFLETVGTVIGRSWKGCEYMRNQQRPRKKASSAKPLVVEAKRPMHASYQHLEA